MNENLIYPSSGSLSVRLVYSITMVLLVALQVNAQGVGSSRGLSSGAGTNTIQGRVYFPAGEQSTGKAVKLRLESTNSAGGQSAVTDQDGVFRFNGLPPGDYAVVVEGGKDYENSREPVNIYMGSAGRIVQVAIGLRPKVDASNPVFAGVPKAALDLYQKGTAAAQKGNAKGAVEFLTQAVAASPTFSLALNELGMQYIKLAQMDKAAETFEALVKLKPGDAAGHLYLGIARYNLNKFADAEPNLREAVKLNSPGPSAHYYLGLTMIKLRRYDEAQKELELTISNGGENLAPAHKFLGGLYMSAHRNKEAADELEKYLNLEPKAADAERIKKTISDLRSKP